METPIQITITHQVTYGGVTFNVFHAKKGEGLVSHSHTFSHLTMCHSGSCILRQEGIEKDETFNPPVEMMEEGNFEKIEKVIDVWYEGIMVMGTNILLQWKLSENMVRPKSASQHAIPNYVACAPRMYKGAIESLCRRMIPFADLIQITHLKLQQVIARTVPDGVFIDADGLNEIDLGTGNAYNPEDALRLYFQTGSVIGRSYTQDGEFNNATTVAGTSLWLPPSKKRLCGQPSVTGSNCQGRGTKEMSRFIPKTMYGNLC